MNSPALAIDRLICAAIDMAHAAGIEPTELYLGREEKRALRRLINSTGSTPQPYTSIEGIEFMGMTVHLSGVPGAAVR